MMRRATLLVPAAFAGSALLCRVWLRDAPAAIGPDLAQPLPVVTYWHAFGDRMWLALFLAVVVAGFGYVAVLRDALAGAFASPRRSLIVVSAGSALAVGAAMLFPVIFSSDVYAYAAYGDMNLRGIDPYGHDGLQATDAILRAAIWQWGNPPPMCVYGPVFVWLAQAVVALVGAAGVDHVLTGLRVLSGGALVACGPLLYAALRGFHPSQRLAAAAAVTLNPVAVWSAAEGHNDALMLVVVLLGFVVARRVQPALGAFIVALSTSVKAPGLAAAACFALFTWPHRSRFLRVVSGTLAGTLVTALVALPFEWGVRNVLVPRGHYTPQFSLQYLVAAIANALFGHSFAVFSLGVAAALLACGAIAFYGAALVARRQREGFAYLAIALWLAIPNPYPWYALWILPVAFLVANRRVAWAIVLASLAIVFRYLPDATVANDIETNTMVTLCELAIPLAAFAVNARALAAALQGSQRER